MQAKQKFSRADALAVVRALLPFLQPHCQRLIVAGSLRRRKSEVGDIELLFIPKITLAPDPSDLFVKLVEINEMDQAIERLITAGILVKRQKANGTETWGNQNKLAIHQASGIPIDFFATSQECWFNYLVCRTGGAVNNTTIAATAKALGWQWNPYGTGFSRSSGLGRKIHSVHSEREVFEFVGLPYLEPWERP